MRFLNSVFLACGGLAATVGAVSAREVVARQTCARGGDVRVIEVQAPGDIGRACDLRYVREGGKNIAVPFNADNSIAYCGERARDLAETLIATGFACDNAAAFQNIRAPSPVDLDAVLAGGAPTKEETPAVEVAAARDPSAAVSIAAAPPVSLTSGAVASRSRPGAPVGRIVGAPPEAGAAPLTPTLASVQLTGPAPAERLSDGSVRAVQDAIKLALEAQAAAWNDGDLAAFMEYYRRSPDFTFVSGSEVTRGWEAMYRRYRSRYGDGPDLGNLGFSDLEIRMLTQDIAIVIGRYAYARDANTANGAFSLVMQRFDGVWRIVHDHTVADAAPTAAPAE